MLLVLVRGRVFMHDIFETFGLRKNVEGGLAANVGRGFVTVDMLNHDREDAKVPGAEAT